MRNRPRPLSFEEQTQRHEERISREAEAAIAQLASARQPVDDESARIRRLQTELGIVRFEDLPAAKQFLAIERTLKSSLQRIMDERDLIHVERHLAGAM